MTTMISEHILGTIGVTREEVSAISKRYALPEPVIEPVKKGRPGESVVGWDDKEEVRYSSMKEASKHGYNQCGIWQAINRTTRNGEKIKCGGKFWRYE